MKRLFSSQRRRSTIPDPSITRHGLDWIDDGLISILLTYNDMITKEWGWPDDVQGNPGIETLLDMRTAKVKHSLRVACQVTMADAMYTDGSYHDYSPSNSFVMCSPQGYNQLHVASVVYACLFWWCELSSYREAGTMRALFARSAFDSEQAIFAIQLHHIKELMECWSEPFGQWVNELLTVIKPCASMMISHLFFHGNHQPLPTRRTGQVVHLPLKHVDHCSWLDVIQELTDCDHKRYNFQEHGASFMSDYPSVRQAVQTFIKHAKAPLADSYHVPTPRIDPNDLTRYPTIYFPTAGRTCGYMKLLCQQLHCGPLVVMCNDAAQREQWMDHLPSHTTLVDPSMPAFAAMVEQARQALRRSSVSFDRSSECPPTIPRPSFLYWGQASYINQHLHVEQKESSTSRNSPDAPFSYIFVNGSQCQNLMTHLNYLGTMHRCAEHQRHTSSTLSPLSNVPLV
jgi:hypothetical protein